MKAPLALEGLGSTNGSACRATGEVFVARRITSNRRTRTNITSTRPRHQRIQVVTASAFGQVLVYMDDKGHRAAHLFRKSLMASCVASLITWIVLLFYFYALAPPDAQIGIAVLMSPCYAAYVGVLVGTLWGALLLMRARGGDFLLGVVIIAGCALLLTLFVGWFVYKILQEI
jgi:hypothetical protein